MTLTQKLFNLTPQLDVAQQPVLHSHNCKIMPCTCIMTSLSLSHARTQAHTHTHIYDNYTKCKIFMLAPHP